MRYLRLAVFDEGKVIEIAFCLQRLVEAARWEVLYDPATRDPYYVCAETLETRCLPRE